MPGDAKRPQIRLVEVVSWGQPDSLNRLKLMRCEEKKNYRALYYGWFI
jgi:hypothetical protein